MKKFDGCYKTRAVWDLKTEKPSETSVDEANRAYHEANKKLNAFKEKIILDNNPKIEFPPIQNRVRHKLIRTVTLKTLKKAEVPLKVDFATSLHFQELDNKFLSASQGKISLKNLNSSNRNNEKIEEDDFFTFDLDNKFSESFKIQISQLKIREESLKKKICLKNSFNGSRVASRLHNTCTENSGLVPKRKKVISITEPFLRNKMRSFVL
jgi:hypothetical protein